MCIITMSSSNSFPGIIQNCSTCPGCDEMDGMTVDELEVYLDEYDKNKKGV